MKRLWIIIIFSLLCGFRASPQSIPISGFVVNQYGSPVAGAQVYICSAAGSSGLPCTPVATIYSDYNLTMTTPNPTQTDANGNFSVYVGVLAFPNTYVVNAIANPGGTPYTWLYPGPSCPLGGCTFTGNVTAPIFNATSSPYYEINGVQISSAALSDNSNLAKLNASNTFTGTTQTASVWNATSGFEVGGTALASTNLSDSANLARLNASNTFTGATNTFAAITGTTINATTGYKVGGVALAASNLSNGVSGTGAVCLASGSACAAGGSVTSVGITSSTATQLTVSGSPITTYGSITLGLNLTGTEAKVVTAAAAGTATHYAVWDSSGGITDGGASLFTSGNNSNGWWVKDPTGTITEHGFIIVTQTGATVATSTITFPLTFPNVFESLVLSVGAPPAGGGEDALTAYATSAGASGSGVTLRCAVNIGGSGCSSIGTGIPVFWIAIGR